MDSGSSALSLEAGKRGRAMSSIRGGSVGSFWHCALLWGPIFFSFRLLRAQPPASFRYVCPSQVEKVQRVEEGLASSWIPLRNRWDSKVRREFLLQS